MAPPAPPPSIPPTSVNHSGAIFLEVLASELRRKHLVGPTEGCAGNYARLVIFSFDSKLDPRLEAREV